MNKENFIRTICEPCWSDCNDLNFGDYNRFVDSALDKKVNSLVKRLMEKKLITLDEGDMIGEYSFIQFNAFLKWLASSENVKLTITL